MRLSEAERSAICETVHAVDRQAQVYLFGSRVDDRKRGGDIDLLIFSTRIDLMEQLKISAEIKRRIGDQKVDIVIAADRERPFVRLAMAEAVLL